MFNRNTSDLRAGAGRGFVAGVVTLIAGACIALALIGGTAVQFGACFALALVGVVVWHHGRRT